MHRIISSVFLSNWQWVSGFGFGRVIFDILGSGSVVIFSGFMSLCVLVALGEDAIGFY